MKKTLFYSSFIGIMLLVSLIILNRTHPIIQFCINSPFRFATQIKYFLFESDPIPSFSVELSKKSASELSSQRQLALIHGNGYRVHENNSGYQRCQIILNDSARVFAKIKLKGGQIGHWGKSARLISYKFKSEYPVLGTTKFGIQAPGNRGYLSEYILHKLCLSIDVIAPKSKFISINFNKEIKGIYFFEEYPNEFTLKRLNRALGPILEFDATELWQNTLDKKTYNQFKVSKLKPKINTYANDSLDTLAYNLLLHSDTIPVTKFDLPKWAKYISLQSICGAYYHASAIQNLQVYYNPSTEKFEPVWFDQTYVQPLYEDIEWGFILKKIKNSHPIIQLLLKNEIFEEILMQEHLDLAKNIPLLLKEISTNDLTMNIKLLSTKKPEVNYFLPIQHLTNNALIIKNFNSFH